MKGFIYKLYNEGGDYYGSTKLAINLRVNLHENGVECCSSSVLKNYGKINYEIVETMDYEDRIELRKREQYYIDNFPCINKIRAYTSNEERIKQKKERWNKVKDKRNAYKREKIDCSICKKQTTRGGLIQHNKKYHNN